MDTEEINTGVLLNNKLRGEKQIYRMFLKFRSIFAKRNVESLYNEDLIASYAKQINKNKTPVINLKTKVLDYGFYQKFIFVKEAATFFAPLFDLPDEELGEFYFTYAQLNCPEFIELVNKKTSPETLSQDQMDNPKANELLVQALNTCIDEMDNKTREKLYEAVYMTNWFMQFSKYPFDRFLGFFSKMPDGLYIAPFTHLQDIFPEFCSLMTNSKPLKKDLFDALFEYNGQKHRLKNPQNLTKENLRKRYLDLTTEEIAHLANFFSREELIILGKIIQGESGWEPPEFSMRSTWVQDLRLAWTKAVEARWTKYVQEVRKGRAFDKLHNYFQLNEFPMLPNRPWTKVRQKTLFTKEYSSGLMNWYIANYYDDTLSFARGILKEGDFINLNNRNDFSEAINLFEVSSNQLIDINFKLAENGKFGQEFAQITDGNMQYFRAQTRIETMMASVEVEIQKSIDLFMKAIKLFINLFDGIAGQHSDSTLVGYEGLRNFEMIKGTQGGDWKEIFNIMRENFHQLYNVMKELIVVDGTK